MVVKKIIDQMVTDTLYTDMINFSFDPECIQPVFPLNIAHFQNLGSTNCGILPSRMKEHGVSLDNMQKMENMEKIEKMENINQMT